MAKDADIGKALAAAIVDKKIPKIRGVQFSYDAYLEDADLPKGVQVYIRPGRLNHTRIARANWQTDTALLLELRAKQSPNLPNEETAERFVEAWLDAWDRIIEVVKGETVAGALASEIEQDERYNPEELNNNQRLVCVCSILYKNIG